MAVFLMPVTCTKEKSYSSVYRTHVRGSRNQSQKGKPAQPVALERPHPVIAIKGLPYSNSEDVNLTFGAGLHFVSSVSSTDATLGQ